MTTVSRRCAIAIVAALSTTLAVGCSDSPQTPTEVYRVARLAPGQSINVDDHSLNDWNDSLKVVSISAKDAQSRQWKKIRSRSPKTLGANDIGITVYMARDADYWYVAVQADDDTVLSASPEYPYSGDCLEVFFVGRDFEATKDFHFMVQPSATSPQAAFFQLELAPIAAARGWDYFPAWRTDARFRQNALSSGFRVVAWRTPSGWSAEARIPLAAFEPDVRRRIERGEAMKMAIDYLDYDTRTAMRSEADGWGFMPDNVLALDMAEANVNTPRYMRSVTFE